MNGEVDSVNDHREGRSEQPVPVPASFSDSVSYLHTYTLRELADLRFRRLEFTLYATPRFARDLKNVPRMESIRKQSGHCDG
jgi:hypothetical protein